MKFSPQPKSVKADKPKYDLRKAMQLKAKNARLVKKIRTPKQNVRILIKKLDTIFSLFIRLRNASKDGMVVCYTSGKIMHYKSSQCGHFVSRRHYQTRWDEKNCQVQSVGENVYNQGNAPQFAINLDKQYGKGTAEFLVMKSKMPSKLTAFEINLLITEYETKVNYLKGTK